MFYFRDVSTFYREPGTGYRIWVSSSARQWQLKRPTNCSQDQGGKTFCASFCASLIAGSRQEFSVRWLCACLLLEFWVECTRCERLLLVKQFYLTCLLFFRCLKITLDSEQPMLKEKRIIPSVWGGISKRFWTFLKRRVFSLIVHPNNLWVDFVGLK